MSKLSKTEKIILVAIAVYLLFDYAFSETDYQKDTRRYHLELVDILQNEPNEPERRDALHELAMEVGAGGEHTVIGTPYRPASETTNLTIVPHTTISESEIVNNIHVALQTRSTMSAQEQARQSNQIAFCAFGVSLVAVVVSFLAKKQIH